MIALALAAASGQQAPLRTHLVIVVDGLRPDYVTPEVMPRLVGLGQRGIVFTPTMRCFPRSRASTRRPSSRARTLRRTG